MFISVILADTFGENNQSSSLLIGVWLSRSLNEACGAFFWAKYFTSIRHTLVSQVPFSSVHLGLKWAWLYIQSNAPILGCYPWGNWSHKLSVNIYNSRSVLVAVFLIRWFLFQWWIPPLFFLLLNIPVFIRFLIQLYLLPSIQPSLFRSSVLRGLFFFSVQAFWLPCLSLFKTRYLVAVKMFRTSF